MYRILSHSSESECVVDLQEVFNMSIRILRGLATEWALLHHVDESWFKFEIACPSSKNRCRPITSPPENGHALKIHRRRHHLFSLPPLIHRSQAYKRVLHRTPTPLLLFCYPSSPLHATNTSPSSSFHRRPFKLIAGHILPLPGRFLPMVRTAKASS
jgi:hypothetical protein